MRTDRVVEEDVPGPWAGLCGKTFGALASFKIDRSFRSTAEEFCFVTLKVALRDPSSLSRTGISLGMTLD